MAAVVPQVDIAAELPADASPSVRDAFAALLGPERWLSLVPNFHVGERSAAAVVPFDEATLTRVNANIRAEGYFQLPPVEWPFPIGDVAAAVHAVVAAGHMPVFTYMYDETWLLFASLARLLTAILGDAYLMQPAFWAWHVDGGREPSGWRPHRDQDSTTLRADGTPKSISIWIPLTEATPRNGCIYLLPADRDPLYRAAMKNNIQLDLQDIRALPSPPGGVLGWTQSILHWGARAAPGAPPRMSLSVEFQRSDEAPFKRPLLSAMEVPAPVQRLKLILRQVLQYQHLYSVAPQLRQVAEAIALRRP